MPDFKKISLSLLSALMCVGIFPVTGLWPLAWAGLVPLFFAISGTRPKYAFFLGWLFGAVHSVGVGYWVFHALYFNSSAGFLVSLLFLAVVIGAGIGLYFAVFCYGAGRLMTLAIPLTVKALLVACLWTALEFCRARFFSGMPWAFLGHSQYPWLTMIQIADITGVYGISFLIVLTNFSLYAAIAHITDRKQAIIILLPPILLISAALFYGGNRLARFSDTDISAASDPVSGANSIAVVQVSVSQKEKWDPEKWQEVLSTLLELSENALKDGAALVVWPETTVPFYLEQEMPDAVLQLFKKYHATLLTGGPRYTGTPGNYMYYNSAYQINGGRILNIYNKIHLLPFGEYFPFGFIDVLKLRYAAPRQYSSGKEPVIFDDRAGRFGALICFEVLFPDLTRALAARGAEFLVNLSNDAWFGKTSEQQQHFSMAVFRAVECRKPVVRSSNTGISGFIDAAGSIINCIPPYDQGYLTYPIHFNHAVTFYCRYGDLFAKLCFAIAIVACLFPTTILLKIYPSKKSTAC